MRLSLDLPGHVEFDTSAYYVGHNDFGENVFLGTPTEVDSHFRVDARLAWLPHPSLELSLVGQNLFDSDHAEWADPVADPLSAIPTPDIERSWYARFTWRF